MMAAMPQPTGQDIQMPVEPKGPLNKKASTTRRIRSEKVVIIKADILPAGGVFLPATDVEPEEGETYTALPPEKTHNNF